MGFRDVELYPPRRNKFLPPIPRDIGYITSPEGNPYKIVAQIISWQQTVVMQKLDSCDLNLLRVDFMVLDPVLPMITYFFYR